MVEDALFSVGQKAYIERDRQLLVLIDPVLGVDIPGGKVQEGETDFSAALKREVTEETGLEIEVLEPFHVWYFEWPPEHRNAGKKACVIDYRCKWISGEVTLSDEHDKFIWINRQNYQDYVKQGDDYYDSFQTYFKN